MILTLFSTSTCADEDFLIIAHRGASGYLPEHTLPAVAMAHGLGADYIEQDVVLTKDKHPIVLHDIHLDTVTDVATKFPNRKREDGRYYAIDFELAEIRLLRVNERIDLATGKPVFPGRFPLGKSRFEIPTLAEEIELIQGLNKSTARDVGIYAEVKQPAWHRNAGFEISRIVIQVLKDYGYESKTDRAYLQCFDPE
ncbi:MAG: glycerophosphodiester phosphodiesterase, partial [Planctomycetota bacterium]